MNKLLYVAILAISTFVVYADFTKVFSVGHHTHRSWSGQTDGWTSPNANGNAGNQNFLGLSLRNSVKLISPRFSPTPEKVLIVRYYTTSSNTSDQIFFTAYGQTISSVGVIRGGQAQGYYNLRVSLPSGTTSIGVRSRSSGGVYITSISVTSSPAVNDAYLGSITSGVSWLAYNSNANKLVAVSAAGSFFGFIPRLNNSFVSSGGNFGSLYVDDKTHLIYDNRRKRYIVINRTGVWAANLAENNNAFSGSWYKIANLTGEFHRSNRAYTYDYNRDDIIIVQRDGRVVRVDFNSNNTVQTNTYTIVVAGPSWLTGSDSIAFGIKDGRHFLASVENNALIVRYFWSGGNLNWRQRNLGGCSQGARVIYNSELQVLYLVERNGKVYQRLLDW